MGEEVKKDAQEAYYVDLNEEINGNPGEAIHPYIVSRIAEMAEYSPEEEPQADTPVITEAKE